MRKNLEFQLRKIIPITSIIIGCLFVGSGILAFILSEEIGLTELGIYGALILASGTWFMFGILGMRTIRIEEQVYKRYGDEGLKELRNTHQAFNWRRIDKNIQPVAGGDAAR